MARARTPSTRRAGGRATTRRPWAQCGACNCFPRDILRTCTGPARATLRRLRATEDVMASQSEKATRFRALHQAPGAFLIANAWDAGSARILAGLGFQAIATSSGAQANTLGRRDGKVSRDEAIAHCRAIVEGTDLPVSADLEKGFADAPKDVAETISLAAGIGLVGGSIEDATGDKDKPLYDIGQ